MLVKCFTEWCVVKIIKGGDERVKKLSVRSRLLLVVLVFLLGGIGSSLDCSKGQVFIELYNMANFAESNTVIDKCLPYMCKNAVCHTEWEIIFCYELLEDYREIIQNNALTPRVIYSMDKIMALSPDHFYKRHIVQDLNYYSAYFNKVPGLDKVSDDSAADKVLLLVLTVIDHRYK